MAPRKYSNNSGMLKLASDESYIIENNCGTVKIGNNCTITCKSNCGTIVIGSNCLVNDARNNCGSITIGEKATVKDASNNDGSIKIGPSSLIEKLKSNCGRIIIGDNSTLVEPIKHNDGEVKLGKNCAFVYSSGTALPSAPVRPANLRVSAPQPVNVNASAPSLPLQTNGPEILNSTDTDATTNQVLSNAAENDNCAICWDRKKNMAFLCGHTCCETCAQTLLLCHICRSTIERKIKLYG